MYDVVPGALQRLREADIISTAGLEVASLGQEYCRRGAVHSTNRQGARLSGIVDLSSLPPLLDASHNGQQQDSGRYITVVEVRSSSDWAITCSCNKISSAAVSSCSHAAALLYQWIAQPLSFLTTEAPVPIEKAEQESVEKITQAAPALPTVPATPEPKRARPLLRIPYLSGKYLSTPTFQLADLLAALPLSDTRSIAKEYEIASNGMAKQELAETIAGAMRQPELVRRVVGNLEKTQRQFLATLILAGGYMSDEELRGLFERFGLGKVEQLQQTLLALQGRALLLRASANNPMSVRGGFGGSLLDMNWYVPVEVQHALHITLPVTTFSTEAQETKPEIREVAPYSLLADLLLVARALDGYLLEPEEKRGPRGNTGNLNRSAISPADGSIAIPPPTSLPSEALLKWLKGEVHRSAGFLRFAYRILRLADILYKDEGETTRLRMLPNAAELLLGPTRTEVAAELFTHWVRQSSYEELYELTEEKLRLRCRATPLGQPALRYGELETENNEARQTLIALLAQTPQQQWIHFLSFARLVYRLNPTFLQRKQRSYPAPHWWLEIEEGRPLHPTQQQDWLRAEGRYLARLLQGPLHWWGVTDIALGPDKRLLAFRLTAMAGLLLSGKPADDLVDLSPGAALENYTRPDILVSDEDDLLIRSSPASWQTIELIERYAEVRGVQQDRLRYRLTYRSLSEALNRGESITPLLDLLRRAATYTSTQKDALTRLLHRLEQRVNNYGQVRLYTDMTLLEVADNLTMRELNATTSVEQHIVQPIRPTLLILEKQGGEQVLDELKRRGQAPLVHEEE
jgi:hypothetical protein